MAGSEVVGVLRALLTADTSEYDKAMKAAGQSTEKVADSIERNLGPRLSTITGLVKGMFGGGDMRRAEEYAQAVEKVGGAAKLVASDQAKVNRVLTEAIEHYTVLGQTAPDHITKLKGELDKLAESAKKIGPAAEAADWFGQKWAAMASAVSVGALADRAISGLVNLGKAAIEDAGHLVDLSAKTGLSTEALQVYGQVAKETGGSLDSVADVVFKLGINIAEGSKETKAALVDLGLGYDALARMAPEEQFETIAAKLHDIENAQERNRLGVATMGKGYKDVAVAIGEGLDSIKDKTVIVGDAQLKAIDAMADRWDRFWDNMIKRAQAGLGSIVMMFDEMDKSWSKKLQGWSAILQSLTGQYGALIAMQKEAADNANKAAADENFLAGLERAAAAGKGGAGGGTKVDLVAEAARIKAAYQALEPAQKKQIEAGLAIGKSSKEISEATNIEIAVIDRYKKAVDAAASATKDLAAERKKLEAEAVRLMWKRDADEIAENEKRLRSLTAAQADLNNILAKRADLNKLPGGIDMKAFGASGGYVDFSGKPGESFFEKAAKGAIGPDKAGESAALKFGAKFSSTLIGAVQGGGSVTGALGGMFGESLSGTVVKKLSGKLAGTIGKTVLGAIPIVGPLLGSIGGQLIGKLFHNEGKDANKLRDSLKAQFGDAGGAGLAELVGKYKESTAVQSAYAEFLAAKTTDSVQKSFDALKGAMQGAVTDVDAKAGRMAEALGRVGAATVNIAGGFAAKLAPATAQIEALKKRQTELAESGDLEAAGAVAVQVLDATKQAAIGNQAEFDRLNRITLASFNAYLGQGKSAIEAVEAVGPAIDSLKSSADAFGFAGSAAFDQLSRWRTLTTDNAPLLDQVSGLNDLMGALGSLGAMNADTFADLQAQGVAAFEQMQAAGFSSAEASTQLAPLLETVLDLHEKTGLAIDAETQAVIDQARADGALKSKQISDQQIMIEGFSAMIKAVGGDIPAAFTKWSDASKKAASDVTGNAKKAADGVTDAFDGLAFNVPVTYSYNGSDLPGVVNPDDLPQHGKGGIAMRPTVGVFGEEGPEALVPLDRLGGLGPKTIILETDGKAWARVHAPYVAGEVQRLQLTR